jgi:diguanylate cyclase (GGDEF)-like protein
LKLSDLCKQIEEKFKEKVQALLYIENDPAFRALLNKFLTQFNIDVVEVFSKEEMLAILEQERFQILTILSKEVKEGFSSLVFNIKTIAPESKILIILDFMILEYLYLLKIDFLDFFSWGVDDFIIKPFSLEEFKAKIFKLLKEYLMFKEIRKIEREDLVTGVFNRKYFEEVIMEETYRALRQKYPLVIFVISVDNFKWYNRHYGHQSGEKILRELAKVLQKSTREKIDKVCRYDEDKFIIIIPYINWRRALAIAERIIKKWEEINKEVSLSIGISQILPERSLERSVSFLINRAKEALELAKKERENSYEVDKETLKLIHYS